MLDVEFRPNSLLAQAQHGPQAYFAKSCETTRSTTTLKLTKARADWRVEIQRVSAESSARRGARFERKSSVR